MAAPGKESFVTPTSKNTLKAEHGYGKSGKYKRTFLAGEFEYEDLHKGSTLTGRMMRIIKVPSHTAYT